MTKRIQVFDDGAEFFLRINGAVLVMANDARVFLERSLKFVEYEDFMEAMKTAKDISAIYYPETTLEYLEKLE